MKILKRIPRPSPALVIACVALAVALGGVSYAATVLPRNSVGVLQLRPNSVNSSKVVNGSLLRADFRSGQIPRGPVGPAGPAGPAGAAGPAGPAGPAGAAAAKSWAVVKGSGALVRQSGVTSISRTGTGRYTVNFSTDISNCAWLATITNTSSGTQTSGEVTTNKDTNTSVKVATSFADATADEDFAIAVFC